MACSCCVVLMMLVLNGDGGWTHIVVHGSCVVSDASVSVSVGSSLSWVDAYAIKASLTCANQANLWSCDVEVRCHGWGLYLGGGVLCHHSAILESPFGYPVHSGTVVQIPGAFLPNISSVHAGYPSMSRWLPWCWWAADV
jgi:hypothetical protein